MAGSEIVFKQLTDNPEDRLLREYYALAEKIRGAFIEQTIWIDHLLSDMLAVFFCADQSKRALLFSEVLTGQDFRFSTRISLLEAVLEKLRPDLAKPAESLIKKLDKIRRLRNRLAHSHLNATREEIAKLGEHKRITFCFYEDGERKEQTISEEEWRVRMAETSEVMQALLILRDKLIPNYAELTERKTK